MVEPVQLREREGEGEKKPHNQTSPQHLRSPLIRGNDASRSQSFPLCLQALCKHKKHPEPINTMTTTHESAGYDRYPPHSKVRKGKKGGKEGRGQEREERQGVVSVWVFFFFFSTSFWTSSDNKGKSWNGISLLFFFFSCPLVCFSLCSPPVASLNYWFISSSEAWRSLWALWGTDPLSEPMGAPYS